MFNTKHQAAVRLGDPTSHGGQVISATSNYILHGIAIAQTGDMAHCPQCKGDYAILPTPGAPTDNGQTLAFEGTATACGATLIASFKA
jgi:uncharacterized Zn-binding protein involved in type VI secretion